MVEVNRWQGSSPWDLPRKKSFWRNSRLNTSIYWNLRSKIIHNTFSDSSTSIRRFYQLWSQIWSFVVNLVRVYKRWVFSGSMKSFSGSFSTRHLLVQSQPWKYQNNVWNLLSFNNKVNNKENRTTSLTSLWCLYS